MPTPSIGLVLGAGGVVGSAYHVGALTALFEVTGWDARAADLVVGTSAGAGIAASLRIGFSPADLFARSQDAQMSDEGRALAGDVGTERLQLPDRPGFDPLGLLRPIAPWLVAPAFLAAGPIRPGLLAGLLPRGTVATTPMGDRIRTMMQRPWPEQPTWICATRVRDGKRVVFGRDDVDVPDLGVAVEASSAVPAYFAPVPIGDHTYFDGATFSPTNADLVRGLGFDLVVVVSPMSAVSTALGPTFPPDLRAGGRTLNARVLGREVGQIRDSGTAVLVLQPTADDLEVMRGDPLSSDSTPAIVRQVRESVTRHLDTVATGERVDTFRAATSPSPP